VNSLGLEVCVSPDQCPHARPNQLNNLPSMIPTSMRRVACFGAALFTSSLAIGAPTGNAEPDVPTKTIDLRTTTPSTHPMSRIYGPGRDEGDAGVPVAGGFDCDGDGHNDYAVGHFLRDPLGRNGAGIVSLIFGDGTINDTIDLAAPDPAVLTIYGAGTSGEREACGSEIWMGDVTGDGMGDLIVCRQNYSPIIGGTSRVGAGALTVIVGSPQLRAMAEAGIVLDFANPPAGISIVDLVGAANNDRMGIWARVGDIDGDGIDDVLVAADQENATGSHSGAGYVLLGGAHLDQSITLDMANFGSTALAGKIARITPPSGASHYHLGSTNQAGDLDGNGRAEIFLSAALNRSGAAVSPSSGSTHATGGAGAAGECFIVWDDNFPATPWPAGYVVSMQNPTGSITRIRGGSNNDTFGEELLGGKDYDGDGHADFFVGDLTGDATGGSRPWSGSGYVFFNAETIKGLDFNIDNAAAMGLTVTTIIGPSGGAIGADTVADGDLDGDGFDDLIFGSPTDSPLGRNAAGTIQIFFGQASGWPTTIDTAPNMFPSQSVMRITEVLGANGSGGFGDSGDTLCYSAAAGDLDDDGQQHGGLRNHDCARQHEHARGLRAARGREPAAGHLRLLPREPHAGLHREPGRQHGQPVPRSSDRALRGQRAEHRSLGQLPAVHRHRCRPAADGLDRDPAG